MPENKLFLPEGLRPAPFFSLTSLKSAQETHHVLESPVIRCDAQQNLHFSLNGIHGIIPRTEAVAPWISGAKRDIAVLSRVGRPTCFTVEELTADAKGAPLLRLSRRAAQEQAMEFFLSHLTPGMVLTCVVTHLESFGAFLDIGCGIVALLPIERISVSRIPHPRERFRVGQKILAAVWRIDPRQRRITMTHRELLGTWLENASHFQAGETVRGIVRSVKDYGTFVELAPNLSGLTECQNLSEGDQISVFIKSIRPEGMKIKLQMIEKLSAPSSLEPIHYQITDGCLKEWVYSPPGYEKPPLTTDFTAAVP